jgi:hypothetical protein
MVSCDSSDAPGNDRSEVFIGNLGNVPLSKLPVVKGAKAKPSSDSTVIYSTDLKPAEAIEATRRLLLNAGWEAYGSEGELPDEVKLYFKSNAIRVNAAIDVDPDQEGKAQISYFLRVLAVDLPAPPDAKEILFDELKKTLLFDTSDSIEDVVKFYQLRLAKLGWTLNTPSKPGNKTAVAEFGFQNAAKESVSLTVLPGKSHAQVRLRHLSAPQTAALLLSQAEESRKLQAQKNEREAKARTIAKLPKLESSGKLIANDKTIKLGHVVAYEYLSFGMKETAICFTDKPLDLPKLKAQLAKDGREPALSGFDCRVKLEVDEDGKVTGGAVDFDNNSVAIIGDSFLLVDMFIEEGRARGTIKLRKSGKLADTISTLDLTFDVDVLKLPESNKE